MQVSYDHARGEIHIRILSPERRSPLLGLVISAVDCEQAGVEARVLIEGQHLILRSRRLLYGDFCSSELRAIERGEAVRARLSLSELHSLNFYVPDPDRADVEMTGQIPFGHDQPITLSFETTCHQDDLHQLRLALLEFERTFR